MYEAVNIRLRPGRVPIPDIVVVAPVDPGQSVIDAAAVRLICEIVSPGNPAADRLLKMHYYAEAGIGWYLLVEQEPEVTLRLYRLDAGRYAEDAIGLPGVPLKLTAPLEIDLDPADLDR